MARDEDSCAVCDAVAENLVIACDADEDALGRPYAEGLIGKLTTVLEDSCVATEGRNTSDVGFPIEEELENRLGAISTRFGDDVIEVGSVGDCERLETLWNVSS